MILVVITYTLKLFIKGILCRNGYDVYLAPDRRRMDLDFFNMIDLIKKEENTTWKSLYSTLLISHVGLFIATVLIILVKIGYS